MNGTWVRLEARRPEKSGTYAVKDIDGNECDGYFHVGKSDDDSYWHAPSMIGNQIWWWHELTPVPKE